MGEVGHFEYKEWWQRGRDKQQQVIIDIIKEYKPTTPEGLEVVQDILDLLDGRNLPRRFRDIGNAE